MKSINIKNNKKEILDGIENFRQKLISRRDADIAQLDKNCDAFIKQAEELGIFDHNELRTCQKEFKKRYIDLYKPYLEALTRKETEIKEGKLDKYFSIMSHPKDKQNQ